jgi:hypothetical protein
MLDESEPAPIAPPSTSEDGTTAAATTTEGGTVTTKAPNTGSTNIPIELTRRYEVNLIARSKALAEPIQLRKIRAKHIGKIVCRRGRARACCCTSYY